MKSKFSISETNWRQRPTEGRDQLTNQSLYQLTVQVPLRETIRERQLKFAGHYIRMPTDEPANRFVIYESRIKSSLRPGAPKTTYLNQISSHILQSGEKSLETGEIRKMAVNKSEWSQHFVVSKKKKPPDRSSKLVRWWWWRCHIYTLLMICNKYTNGGEVKTKKLHIIG